MNQRQKQFHRGVKRTFAALRKFRSTKDPKELFKLLKSLGRTMNRIFSKDEAFGMHPYAFEPEGGFKPESTAAHARKMPLVGEITLEHLHGSIIMCSDRWGLHRYLRCKMLAIALKERPVKTHFGPE